MNERAAAVAIGGSVYNSQFIIGPHSIGAPVADAGLAEQQKEEIRDGYLTWLTNELKSVPGVVKIHGEPVVVPLDRVFVSLRGYPGSVSEISQAALLRPHEDRYEEPSILLDRDLRGDFADNRLETVALAEAFQQRRAMIVLGDPGSGKTTIARWLALAFAKAAKNGEPSVLVPEIAVDANSFRPDEKVALGVTRLPIYLRIADLAEEYRLRKKRGVLADMLGNGKFVGSPVYNTGDERHGETIAPEDLTLLFKDALRNQQAVIFLDGLDEIANPEDRGEIVKLLHGFLDSFFAGNADAGTGNQLLVTSRIIGYEDHPLRDQVARYTIEHLSEPMMAQFIDCWHDAYAEHLATKAHSAAEAASIASAGFKSQIFDPEREALRELASNPFMLSLLCVLNQEHDQKLPSSRASLYEMLVGRGLRSLFLEKRESHRKLGELVNRILMLLAYRMHTTTSNGLLPHGEIEEIIWSAVSHDRAGAQAVESRAEAFRLVVQSVGLLDQRGERQYGFKHQTIQEFLAGKLLVEDETAAAGNLIGKSSDPRWREAVLLGLGWLCESLPEDRLVVVCREVAAATSGNVPSGAILLAQVIREFAPVPTETVGTTVEILLSSYEQLATVDGTARFSAFVELFVSDLLIRRTFPKPWRAVAERACLSFAGSVGGSRSLARLLYARRIAVPSIVVKLLGALYLDGEDSGWIVNRALEMIATADARRAGVAAPVTDTVCSQLTPQTVATLRDPKLVESLRYTPGMRAASLLQETEISVDLLPFREALEEMPGATEFVRADLAWLRLVTALFGGVGSFDASVLRDALQDGRATMTSPAVAREDAERIGRLLDTEVQPEWEWLKDRPPALNPRWIYRDSPLTPLLVRCLHERMPLAEAVPQLLELWNDPEHPRARSLAAAFVKTAAGEHMTIDDVMEMLLSDTLMALTAASSIDRELLSSRDGSPLHERALRRFTGELKRLLTAARDPLLRSARALESVFAICAEEDGAGAPAPDAEADADALPEEFDRLDLSSDTPEATRQLSEQWLRFLRAGSPEAARRAAVFIDCAGKRLAENPEALFWSWLATHLSDQRTWSHPRDAEIACFSVASDDADVARTACFGGIESLPDQFEFLKAFALIRFAALAEANPELKTLAASLALSLPTPVYRKAALSALFRTETCDEAAIRRAIREGTSAAEPDHPIVAFRALRYADAVGDPAWRRALLDSALRVRAVRIRTIALMQTALALQHFAEEATARKELAALVPQLSAAERDVVSRLLNDPVSRARESEDRSSFLTAFCEVGDFLETLRVDTPKPIAFLRSERTEQQAVLFARYLRSLFANDSEDREYSVAVVLDTVGRKLDLPPACLKHAFALSLPLAVDLRWDTSGLMSLVSLSDDERDEYLDCLSFIALIPPGFDFFAAWALSRIGYYVRSTAPEWAPLLTMLAARIGDAHRPLAMRAVEDRWRAVPLDELSAGLQREALLIGDPFVRFHTLRLFRKSGVPVPWPAVLDAANAVERAARRETALFHCVIELANEIAGAGSEPAVRAAIDRCDPETRRMLLALAHRSRIEDPGTQSAVRIVLAPPAPRDDRPRGDVQREVESATMRWLTSRAHRLTAPEDTVALAVTLNALWAQSVLDALPWRQDPSNWEALADLASRTRALAALAAAGLKEPLIFDDSVLEAIRRWIADGTSFGPLEPILPLVVGGSQTATPQLEEWFAQYPSHILGAWACVMLAERDRWSGAVVDALIGLLNHPNDLLRNRAAIAVTMRGPTGRMTRSSAIGEEALLALVRASTMAAGAVSERHPKLSASARTPIRWAFESLLVDTQGLLTRLRDEYANGGGELAGGLYRRLNYVSPPVLREIASLLRDPLPLRLRVDLTRGLLALWYRSWYRLPQDDPLLAEIRAGLWEALTHPDRELRFIAATSLGFAAGRSDIERLAEMILTGSEQRAELIRILAINTMSSAAYSRKIIGRGSVIFQTLLNLLGGADAAVSVAAGSLLLRMEAAPEDVRERMRDDARFLDACFSAADFYFIGDDYYAHLRRIGRGIERITSRQTEVHGIEEHDLFAHALRKAYDLMASGKWRYDDVDPPNNLCNILPLCAAAAEMMPDLYRRMVETFLPESFAEKLALAVAKGDAFTVREAGLVLLALLRVFSAQMRRALTAASSDVYHVQQTAMRQIARLRRIDPEAVTELEQLLEAPSANMSYVAARIIVSALQSRVHTAGQHQLLRRRANAALAGAAERTDPNAIVSLLESGDGFVDLRSRNVGRLRDVLNNALLELSSVYLDETGHEQIPAEATRIRMRTNGSGEMRTFDVWLGERAAEGAVPNQRAWVEKVLRLTIPQETTEALNDLQKVAKESGVSCAALARFAQLRA